MKKRVIIFPLFMIFVCCLISACGNSDAQTEKIYVHFFVVPDKFPDGTSAENAISDLKNYLVEIAGGYTQVSLRSKGGWKNPEGIVIHEDHIPFMVSASINISEELKDYITTKFKQQYAYVIVWEAKGGI